MVKKAAAPAADTPSVRTVKDLEPGEIGRVAFDDVARSERGNLYVRLDAQISGEGPQIQRGANGRLYLNPWTLDWRFCSAYSGPKEAWEYVYTE